MENMRFKVGDRVRIKSLDWYNENINEIDEVHCGNTVFIPDMVQYINDIVTISEVFPILGIYHIKEDSEMYNWTDEMIECLVEDDKEIVEETTIKIKDLRKFINQMEIEGLNDETVLTFETKRSSGCIENITSMEYSPTTNILIFS